MHGLAEVEEAARSARLQAWVASLSSPGPRAAAALPPPPQRVDLTRTQLFSSWEAWTQFLSAPPAVPALSRVLDAVVRIARLVDVHAPVNATDIVAAIVRAKEHRGDLPHPRETLLTLKFRAVTDALQHVYSHVPKHIIGNKGLDLSAVASFANDNSGILSRAESDNRLDNGFVRVTSEHFPHVPQEIAAFAEAASLSLEAAAPSKLRMNFESVLSLGRTEPSTTNIGVGEVVGPDCHGFAGNTTGQSFDSGNSGMVHASSSVKRRQNVPESWSEFLLNAPSKVEEAAGSLYCAAPVDDLWQIGEAIGAGSFSNVHYVTSVADGTRAAIKIVYKDARDLFTEDGTCREVAAFCRIGHHDSVVKCLQVFEDDRFVYIVMELLTGGRLIPRVADASHYGIYSETDARNIAYGLARGLAYCHAHGIAHRDVKPENILFVSENDHVNVKLTDFGIAHVMTGEGAMEMVGTPLYVAPEVLLQQPYGCAADMWSLGVIVHILLTGFPPFDDEDIVVLINKVKSGVLSFDEKEWGDVSPSAKDFVVRLLCRDPKDRLSAAEALSHPWLRAVKLPERKNSERLPPRQPSLQSVQTNLKSFVQRKDSRPHLGSSHKLSLLVSLSERTLKGSPSEHSNRFSVDGRRQSGGRFARRTSLAYANPAPVPSGDAVTRHHSTPTRAEGASGEDKKSKRISSPRRRPVRGRGRTDIQETQLNHSEFQPSYLPIEDSTTEKLHEMVDISAAFAEVTPASPKSMPPPTPAQSAPTTMELSGLVDRRRPMEGTATSLSTTTTTPISGTSLKLATADVTSISNDDMDQSNILFVKLDESLQDRRQANADLDSPARRAKQGMLRTGNRSSRKRTKSVSALRIFRKSDSQVQK